MVGALFTLQLVCYAAALLSAQYRCHPAKHLQVRQAEAAAPRLPSPTPPRPRPPQIASACGKSADECEALYRRQHAYLSIPSALQSTPAFAAMVVAAQKDEPVKEEPPASQQRSRSLAPGEDGGEASGAAGSRRHGSSGEEEEGEEDEEPGLAAGRARRTPKRGGLLSPGGRVSSGRAGIWWCATQ